MLSGGNLEIFSRKNKFWNIPQEIVGGIVGEILTIMLGSIPDRISEEIFKSNF